MQTLEFGSHAGPKTTIVLFAYGGVHPSTVAALVEGSSKSGYITGRADRTNETLQAQGIPPVASHWPVSFTVAPGDALVSRSRSVMAQRFLETTDSEVLLMLDHDLWWVPPSKDYEGDLCHIARQCAETKGIVGAAVSKKVRGQGIASMLKRDGEFSFGCEPALEPTWFVGAAFTAYHRDMLKRISDEGYLYGKHVCDQKVPQCAPGFKPIFMEMVIPHPLDGSTMLHLSEDWAMCHRARELGYESFISCKPLVIHFGEYGFQVVRDSPPELPQPSASQQHYEAMPKASKAISCLHATRGRPQMATDAVRRWAGLAADRASIEYIVSIDDDDPTMADWTPPEVGMPVTVVIGSSRGNVDAYNRAYHKSGGKVLVQVHDDVTPPQDWDRAVLEAIGSDLDKPVALAVSDGLSSQVNHNPELMTVAIVTRPFAERLGGLFYPEYVSIACDNDLTEFAKVHGYRRDARGLLFGHDWQGADRDETQKRSYRTENWQQGQDLLNRRAGTGFPEAPHA